MRNLSLGLLAMLTLVAAQVQANPPAELLGEWAVEPSGCNEARLSYEIDGIHRAWIRDEAGNWAEADRAEFRVEDSTLIIVASGEAEHKLPILGLDDRTLRFGLDDTSAQAEFGVAEIVLYRCPAR